VTNTQSTKGSEEGCYVELALRIAEDGQEQTNVAVMPESSGSSSVKVGLRRKWNEKEEWWEADDRKVL
jgi:hypothetical protein